MIKVKDGYAKLIGVSALGAANQVLLSNGGNLTIGNAENNIPLNNNTVNINLNSDLLDGYHADLNATVNTIVLRNNSGAISVNGLINDSHYTWKSGVNFNCIPTSNGGEWSFDLGSTTYNSTENSSYTGNYLQIWSCKHRKTIASFFNDTRYVGINTESPSYPLHILGMTYTDKLLVNITSAEADKYYIDSNYYNLAIGPKAPSTGGAILLYRPDNTTQQVIVWSTTSGDHAGISLKAGSDELSIWNNKASVKISKGLFLVSNIGNDSPYNFHTASMQIREYNYEGAQTDTWGNAPRLAWHWAGRTAAQIGLASNGLLYYHNIDESTIARLVYELGTWAINISGNAATATKADYTRYLQHKTLDATTLNNQSGSFAFSGCVSSLWNGADWTGILLGDSVTKSQIVFPHAGQMLFRTNDIGGTDAASWDNWHMVLHDGNYTSYTDGRYVNVTGDTMTGHLHLAYGTSANMTYGSGTPLIIFSESGIQPVALMYTDYDSYRYPAGLKVVGNQGGEWFEVVGSCYAAHFYENSDIKLKTNISDISDSNNIPQLRLFDWKFDGSHSYGLIAQELEEMGYSELVDSGGEHKTVKYSAALSLIVGKLLVKIQEIERENKELRDEINNLKNNKLWQN